MNKIPQARGMVVHAPKPGQSKKPISTLKTRKDH